jgi:hypothetical protein
VNHVYPFTCHSVSALAERHACCRRRCKRSPLRSSRLSAGRDKSGAGANPRHPMLVAATADIREDRSSGRETRSPVDGRSPIRAISQLQPPVQQSSYPRPERMASGKSLSIVSGNGGPPNAHSEPKVLPRHCSRRGSCCVRSVSLLHARHRTDDAAPIGAGASTRKNLPLAGEAQLVRPSMDARPVSSCRGIRPRHPTPLTGTGSRLARDWQE